MGFLQEIHGEVGRGVYRVIAVALSEKLLAVREKVERPLRHVDLKSGYFLGELHDEVTPALECLPHVLDALLVALISGEGCALCHVVGAAGVLALQLVHALDDPFRSRDPSEAPSCHGISLADAVADYRAVFHVGRGGDACLEAHIINMFVNLVGQHVHTVVLLHHFSQGV